MPIVPASLRQEECQGFEFETVLCCMLSPRQAWARVRPGFTETKEERGAEERGGEKRGLERRGKSRGGVERRGGTKELGRKRGSERGYKINKLHNPTV